MKVLFLGTSSSEPLPRADGCVQCRSTDPRDRRQRSSLLVEDKILLDANPDILSQFERLRIPIDALRLICLTHGHEDAAGGVKKLEHLGLGAEVWQPMADGEVRRVLDIRIRAILVPHTPRLKTFAFELADRSKRLLYATDFAALTPPLLRAIGRAHLAILDGSALRGAVFGRHLPIRSIIEQVSRHPLRGQVYFSHNGHTHLPHTSLERQIQKLGGRRFHLAFDGLKLEV